LEIIPVRTVDEVLKHALTRPIEPIDWEDSGVEEEAVPPASDGDEASEVVRH